MDFPLPVFLDKSYVARAFPEQEVIISTQSSYHLYESPISCNHAPVYVNLNYPYHSIMQAIVRLLTSTLPHHLAHSSPHSPSSQWADVGGRVSADAAVVRSSLSHLSKCRRCTAATSSSTSPTPLTASTSPSSACRTLPLSPSSASLQTNARWRRLVAALVKEHQHLMEYVELLTVMMEGREGGDGCGSVEHHHSTGEAV